MKTTPHYYEHSTAEPFQAEIREIRAEGDKTAILLDRTVFYPEGGGQAADRGTINGVSLLDVREAGKEILHFVVADTAARLAPGPVTLVLDAARRRDFTVQHSAQHLLSGNILALTGAHTVSMRLGEEIATIDVETPELGGDILAGAEEAAMRAIEADVPVITHLCPPENAADFPLRKTPPAGEDIIRVVEIAGNDFSPCCGTHVPSAGRIGMVRVLGAEKYKGMTRVTFIAGRRVIRDSRMLRQNGETISRALKVPVAETGEAVLALAGKTAALEKQVKELMAEAAGVRAAALVAEAGLSGAAGTGRVFGKLFPDTGMEELLTLGRAAQNLTGAALVFASGREAKFAAFSAAKDADLKSILKARMDETGGRGGGNGGFFQGAFSSAGDLARFMESLPQP